MAILDPNHLLEQAEQLLAPPSAGPPRQVDLRRAVSAAYYGIFHAVLIRAADEFVGKTKRQSTAYALVYRSIDHKNLFELCTHTVKPQLPQRLQPYVPTNGFGANIQAFSAYAIDLKLKRNDADYNPLIRVRTSDAKLAVSSARSAIDRFDKASASRRGAFLALLVFPPR